MPSTITLRDADRILPLYLICDTSLTMSVSRNGGRRPIDVLNESIDNIFQVIDKRQPTTVDIHVSVISFNTRASLSREMAAIDSGATMLPLTSSGVTNLAPALGSSSHASLSTRRTGDLAARTGPWRSL